MTGDEATKTIDYLKEDYKELLTEEDIEALDMAIEALKSESIFTADRPKGEWIPVIEKLPDIEQDVLATTTLFGTREITFAWRINDGEWLIREGSSEAANNDILAWMPLPEPYKGGDAE